jgi:hypothetical protein
MSDKESLTEKMNNANIASVRKQIHEKNGCDPYYGTVNDAVSVVTDMDHFPYTRFFRGVYKSTYPVVMERESGWRPQRNSCYSVNNCNQKAPYPNHCFQTACSTVYPCYSQSDSESTLVKINNECIVQYR